MRILIAAVAFAVLAGCSSSADLMSSTPEVTVTSAKTPKAFALCVFPEWQEHNSNASMTETSTGYRLVNGFAQQTDDVLDIREAKSGSVAKLYQRVAWSQIGRGGLRDSLQQCR
ncbi:MULTISPECIES: hypothetical protein [unclassified Pseudomonas]|uniref:hypothetical protein n=1 Tax=unclassified Pseudomonas TaxID=196821 RepID=UPI000CD2774D|nr:MULTISPECIES: hypothetical protein [unclassified Pseudomonas]POA52137.1 hypothetical protein C1889_24390 [Pseudomonas sp. FW507-12TSA]